jgi:hypothetical protein
MAKENRSWNRRKRPRFETGKLGRKGFKESLDDLGIEKKIINTRGDDRQGGFGLVDVRAGRKGLPVKLSGLSRRRRLIWLLYLGFVD